MPSGRSTRLAAVLESVQIKSHQRFLMARGSPGRRVFTVSNVGLGFLLFVFGNGRKIDGRQTFTLFAGHLYNHKSTIRT